MRLNVPLVGAEELSAVADVLKSGFLTQGPRAAQFESLIAGRVGSAFAFATSSATTGLHLALAAIGVKPGDEVVIPDFSFPATANAVIQQGAVPVFVDIELATYNMHPALLSDAITDRTAAIMPVHAFGLCADMAAINEIAGRHSLPVVEDAACALGGSQGGVQAGALGDLGVFSFHPRKVITTGEGGMITTSDPAAADRIRTLRTHGGVRRDLYLEFVEAGFNYRLSDVHAALGVAQMARLDHILERRRTLASSLGERLGDVEGVLTPSSPAGVEHTYQSYVVLLDPSIDRDEVIREMRKRDVETTLGTYAMHLQPYFKERFSIDDDVLPNATTAQRSALTLPLYPQLEERDLDQIAAGLNDSINAVRSKTATTR